MSWHIEVCGTKEEVCAAIDEAVVAGSLHAAAESLADATGAALGTDLLDRIFARHCIGK